MCLLLIKTNNPDLKTVTMNAYANHLIAEYTTEHTVLRKDSCKILFKFKVT